MPKTIDVAIEIGKKRVFASALDWPGWCRSGRDEPSALAGLIDFAPRYARVVAKAAPDFVTPKDVKALRVTDRLPGNMTTDFGAPSQVAARETKPMKDKDLDRLIALHQACWSAFDSCAAKHRTAKLASGPRGGGRDVAKMVAHVNDADAGYLGALGGKSTGPDVKLLRRAFVEALKARAHGEIPDRGPRGGVRWLAPFAIRRSAWHALDHMWEIEDRAGR